MNRANWKRSKRYKDRRSLKRRGRGEFCPLCNKPLRALFTAIVHKETGNKAHFDCVLKELKKTYHLNPKEDIYYIGSGYFGIIERIKDDVGKQEFIVKKRIQYEERR